MVNAIYKTTGPESNGLDVVDGDLYLRRAEEGLGLEVVWVPSGDDALMRYRTKRLIRKNLEFAGLMLLGPLGGEIHAKRWPGEATFTNTRTWPGMLGPKPVAAYDRKHGRRAP